MEPWLLLSSQRPPLWLAAKGWRWRCIAGEELKEFPVSHREGSFNAVSAEMVQLLPHLAPVIFPNPHIRKVLPLLINIWEPLLLYGARWENRRNRIGETLVSLWKHCLAHQFLSSWMVLLEVPCSPCFLHPIQCLVAELSSSCISILYSLKIYHFHLYFFLSTPSVWPGLVRMSWVASPNSPVEFFCITKQT